jgi:hypothetical protein
VQGVGVTFSAREKPLLPVAVAGVGAGARSLAAAALRLGDDSLRRFSGVASASAVVLLGPSDVLPWFDGALYLGALGGLLCPTWAQPDVHPQLLERALRRALPDAPAGPLAMLFSSLSARPFVVPVAGALPLSREKLAKVLGRE